MERRGPTPGSGSYGQACMQCAKAKCRCVARLGGVGCERCVRLKKPCQPSSSLRRRGAAAAQNHQQSDAQIAKLEGRIDALTAMLQSFVNGSGPSHANLQPTPSDSSSISSNNNNAASTSRGDELLLPAVFADDNTPALLQPSPFLVPREPPILPSPQLEPPPPPLYGLSLNEAEWHLDRFQSQMLPCFPFVFLPPGTTAQQMCRDQPFLLQAILAVATPSTQQKTARAERLKQVLTQSAMLDNQSSMDMLLSALTYVTWSTDPFRKRANNLSRMMMLAISLVYDLQLAAERPLPPEAHIIATMTPGFERPPPQKDGSGDASDHVVFLERQRALLACFVLSSIISASFRRIPPLPWTTQMEGALRRVEASVQCASDASFAVLVRLQALIEQARCVRNQSEAEHTAVAPPAPAYLYIKLLQGQLTELRDTLAPDLPRRDMLLACTHYAGLCLNEATRLATSEEAVAPPPVPRLHGKGRSDGSGSGGPRPLGFEHIGSLWRSGYAAKAWLDAFRTIPAAAYVGFPFFVWFQLVRCVIVLKHLSTFADPAWDGPALCDVMDMGQMLAWMADKAEQASSEAGERADDDLFRRLGRMLRSSQRWMAMKQEQQRAAVAAAVQGGAAADGAAQEPPLSGEGEDEAGQSTAESGGVNDAMMDIDPSDAAFFNALGSGEEGWLEELLGWSPTAM